MHVNSSSKQLRLPQFDIEVGGFSSYRLLDSGNRKKLEQFGPVTVVRGEPKAWWTPTLPARQWNEAAAVYDEDAGWKFRRKCTTEWALHDGDLTYLARLSDTSKHLGVFPEQSPHWAAIRKAAPKNGQGRLLNLFGYTGAATLQAARAGWHATHVDASKAAVHWGRANQAASGMQEYPIRWIVEDAMQYVRREYKRNSRYDAILLDPPAFGRGPTGQIWKVERQLTELLDLCRAVLTERPRLVLLTTYNIEASALMLHNLVADMMADYRGQLCVGELALSHASNADRFLPLSIFARWTSA